MWHLILSVLTFAFLPFNDTEVPAIEWRVTWQKSPNAEEAQLIRAENYYRDGRLRQVKDYINDAIHTFEYDSLGELLREQGTVSGWGSYETRYSEDLVLRIERLADSSTVRKIYRYYNPKGQAYEERHYENDSVYLHVVRKYNSWDSLIEVSYHRMPWTKDVTTKRILIEYNPSTKRRVQKYEYNYEGLLVEETYYEYQHGTQLIGKKVITHMPEGNITYRITYYRGNKPAEIVHDIPYEYTKTTKTFTYDKKHRPEKAVEITFKDDMPRENTVTRYYYGQNERPTKTETVTKAADGSRLSSKSTFYNEYGYISNERIENNDGVTEVNYLYVYYK